MTGRIICTMSYPSSGTPMHGGHPAQADYYSRPPVTSSRGPQGTPLGRIVAGVFLGLLAWSALMLVVLFAFSLVAANFISDTFDDTGITDTSTDTEGTGLSAGCKAALDTGNLAPVECADDDPGAVSNYSPSP